MSKKLLALLGSPHKDGATGIMLKYVLREEKKYKKLLEHNENIPEDIQRRHDVNLRCMEEERMQDIICFLGKYPSLSKSQLAKRVLWESEYWY